MLRACKSPVLRLSRNLSDTKFMVKNLGHGYIAEDILELFVGAVDFQPMSDYFFLTPWRTNHDVERQGWALGQKIALFPGIIFLRVPGDSLVERYHHTWAFDPFFFR